MAKFINKLYLLDYMKKANGVHPEIIKHMSEIKKGSDELRKAFGTLKFKKPTQQMMDEIDEF